MTDQQDLRARLPELPEPAWPSPVARQPYYTADQMRAYALEAAAQLGRVESPQLPAGVPDDFTGNIVAIVMDLQSVLCDAGGRVCIEGSERDRAIVQEALDSLMDGVTIERAHATLTSPQPDSAAPGGDVEQMASFERWVSKRWGCATEKWADSGEYKSHLTRDWWQCWQAALSAPKQVGVSCAGELLDGLSDTFKGDDLQLLSSARSLLDLDKSGALVPHGIGGHARGIIEAFIVRMAYAPQAAPVHVEGEGRKAIYQAYWTVEGVWEDLTREQFDALEDTEAVTRILYDVPPEQPAVGLEQFRPAVETYLWTYATNEIFEAVGDPKKYAEGNRLLALLDGAKAGKGESE